MPEPLQQAMIDSATFVMETAAFMTIWPWSEEDGNLPEPDVAATITFVGARNGRLTLRVASQILGTLSQNMLGDFDEGDASLEKTGDALREMLNIMCGNVLTAWYGSDPVFKLNPPEILDAAAETESGEPDVQVKFCLDNTLCIVEARIEGGIANDDAAQINASVPGEN